MSFKKIIDSLNNLIQMVSSKDIFLKEETEERYKMMEQLVEEREESINKLNDQIKDLDKDIKKASTQRDKERKELDEKTKNLKKDDLSKLLEDIENKDEEIGNLMKERAKLTDEMTLLKTEMGDILKEMKKIEKLIKKEEKLRKKEEKLVPATAKINLLTQHEEKTGKRLFWHGKKTKAFVELEKTEFKNIFEQQQEWREIFIEEFLTKEEAKNPEISWYKKYKIALDYEIYLWILYGFTLDEAINLRKQGFTPEQAYHEKVTLEIPTTAKIDVSKVLDLGRILNLDLIEQFEKETGKNAYWHGKETKAFQEFKLRLSKEEKRELMEDMEITWNKSSFEERLKGVKEYYDWITDESQLHDYARRNWRDLPKGFKSWLMEETGKILQEMESSQVAKVDLIKLFEEKTGKKAIWHGKETKAFQQFKLDSITIEEGESKDIKGNVYIGRDVEDKGEAGYSHISEIEDTLRELEIDMKVINRKQLNARLMRLSLIVARSNKGELKEKENKVKALELINKFREKVGFNPLDIEKYLSKTMISNIESWIDFV